MEVTNTFRIPNNLPLREVTPFYKILNLAYYALSSILKLADFFCLWDMLWSRYMTCGFDFVNFETFVIFWHLRSPTKHNLTSLWSLPTYDIVNTWADMLIPFELCESSYLWSVVSEQQKSLTCTWAFMVLHNCRSGMSMRIWIFGTSGNSNSSSNNSIRQQHQQVQQVQTRVSLSLRRISYK